MPGFREREGCRVPGCTCQSPAEKISEIPGFTEDLVGYT